MRTGRNNGRRGYRKRRCAGGSGIAEGESSRQFLSRLRAFLTELAVTAALIAALFTLLLGVTVQHGTDMYPAIRDGDIILYLRTRDILNTEAVVYEAEGEIHSGRTAACAGTKVGSTGDGQLTFDGIFMPVSYEQGIFQRTYAAPGEKLPLTVGEGHYFILGDNRKEAKDSREYGEIDRKRIKGRIISVLRRRRI
jgi:signal peptidase I